MALLALAVAMGTQAAHARTLPVPEYFGIYLVDGVVLMRLEKCPEYDERLLVKQCCYKAEKVKIRDRRPTIITYLDDDADKGVTLYSIKFDDFEKGLYKKTKVKIAEWPVENVASPDQGQYHYYRPAESLKPGVYFLSRSKGGYFPFMVTAPNPLPIPQYHGTYLVDRGMLRRLENCPKKGEDLLVNQCCFLAEKVKIKDKRPIFITYLESFKEPGLLLYLYEFQDFKKGYGRKGMIEMSEGPVENASLTEQMYMRSYRQLKPLDAGVYVLSNKQGAYFSFVVGSPPLPPHASDIEDRLITVEWGLYMVGGLDPKTQEIQEWRQSYIGGEWTIIMDLKIDFSIKEPLEPLLLDNEDFSICVGDLVSTNGKPAKAKSTCDLFPGIYEVKVGYEERSKDPPYSMYREDSFKKTVKIDKPVRFEVVIKEGLISDFTTRW